MGVGFVKELLNIAYITEKVKVFFNGKYDGHTIARQ